ncbi:MAG: threonine ammonia-lyase [Burkholderiales bacterium]|jgi:threonine dehydratase|nr:threonine ammonia-lyase [Burkholderiales bacterium]
MSVTFESVRDAAGAIVGSVVLTPFLHSQTFSEITGADVWIKYENEQFTAAFKERGALFKLLSLSPGERARGVLAVSAGNHAQAVAYHARRLGIRAVIVMPRFTPHVKVERTRAHGAEVVLAGDGFDAAKDAGRALAAERGLVFVHPYDDAKVIAGQGTVALEMLTANPSIETLVVPIGGGGLVAGMATAAKAMNPDIEVIGVETAGFPAMKCALDGTTPRFARSTIAEGIAVKEPGALTLPIVRRLVSDILLVEEGDIEQAIVMLLEIEKTVAEGAGAAGFAAMLRHPERFRGKRVGVVLCGGNIDPLVLSEIIQRGLVRSGRLLRLRVELPDLPGALADVTRCLADTNANIEEVHHQRAFTSLPVLSAEVEFVLQARGADHVTEIRDALAQAGYRSELVHEAERLR